MSEAANIPLPDLDRFNLQVTVHIEPHNVPKFFEAMEAIWQHVTKEPECIYMEIFQDPESPGTISWTENWNKSPKAFMAENITKEYYKPYFEITEPMFVKPREFKILKRVGAPFVFSKEAEDVK